MMRILHLISTFGAGGIERWLLGILPYMDLKNYEMDFYCRLPDKGVLEDEVISSGGKIFHHKGHKLNLLSYSRQLKTLIKKNKYDIIHNHLAHHGGIPAYISNTLNIPSIVSFHNAKLAPMEFGNTGKRFISKLYAQENLKYMIKHGKIITGCSSDVLESINSIVSLKDSETKVLEYGVNIPKKLSKNERIQFKKSINVNENVKIVVNVGRFNPQKNHYGFLDIAKKIIEKRKDVVFVLVGDGELRNNIENYAVQLGINDYVRFLGVRNDVESIFFFSDIFLFPSLFEGLPVACLEAQAAGLPVIGANVPGIKLLVKNEFNGFLCKKNDINSFVSYLEILLDDANLRNKMGEHGKEFIKNNYSYDSSANNLMCLYKGISDK